MRPLRIAHFADSHLGYRSNAAIAKSNRAKDFERSYEAVCDAIAEWRPDLVLLAGDVFHQTRPPWSAISSFIRGADRLASIGGPIVVIAGNHDTSTLRTEASVFTMLRDAKPELTIAHGYEAENLLALVPDCPPLNIDAVPFGALKKFKPQLHRYPGALNLLTTHGTAPGVKLTGRPTLGHLDVGEDLTVVGYDYVALGHIHEWQSVRKGVAYSGSTERCGWGDEAASPGWLKVELAPGSLQIEHVDAPARPMATLAQLDAEGLRPETVVEAVVSALMALDDPETLARIAITGASRVDWGVIERQLKEYALQYCHAFQMGRTTEDFNRRIESAFSKEPPRIGPTGIIDAFHEYLEQAELRPEIFERLSERGEEALLQAQRKLDEEEPT